MSLMPHLPRRETDGFQKNRGAGGRFAHKSKESNTSLEDLCRCAPNSLGCLGCKSSSEPLEAEVAQESS